jgi:uncharacterized membrane protein YoaK (UPF0700 family)
MPNFTCLILNGSGWAPYAHAVAWRLRVSLLALSAGCVDAVGFLVLFRMFTAHLSGDTTKLAVDLGSGHFDADALAFFLVLVTFLFYLLVVLSALAMGLQTAYLRRTAGTTSTRAVGSRSTGASGSATSSVGSSVPCSRSSSTWRSGRSCSPSCCSRSCSSTIASRRGRRTVPPNGHPG